MLLREIFIGGARAPPAPPHATALGFAVQVTLPNRDFLPELMLPGFAWQVVKTIDI